MINSRTTYDPTIGRFITPDPIGFLGGDTNFYRYVGNDPVNYTDPSGLIAFLAPIAALGVEEAVAGLAVLGARLAPYVPRAVAAIRGANWNDPQRVDTFYGDMTNSKADTRSECLLDVQMN